MDIERIRAILASEDTSELDAYLTSSADAVNLAESSGARVAELELALAEVQAKLQATQAHNYELITAGSGEVGESDPGESDDDSDDDDDLKSLDDYL